MINSKPSLSLMLLDFIFSEKNVLTSKNKKQNYKEIDYNTLVADFKSKIK